MAQLPPLPTLVAFEAVARRRSFALAAGELNLTASAVSHQIAKLEDFLGVRMFDRSPQGVKLSVAGESYLRRVAGALGAISAATEDVRQGVRNSLYVHASPSFASLWLMPRLANFAQAHPGISLFLSASPTHSDFALGQADLDIRYGLPQWPDLVVQPLFEEPILPLASPAFLERHRLREPAEQGFAGSQPQMLGEVGKDQPALAASNQMRRQAVNKTTQHAAVRVVDRLFEQGGRTPR